MCEKKIYTEQEAKEYAERAAETIIIRTGNGMGVERETTKEEKEILTNIITGALIAIKWHKLDNSAIQIAKNTAEFTGNLMIPDMNGYLSVYNKIGEFVDLYQE